jgi:hypothetical protein
MEPEGSVPDPVLIPSQMKPVHTLTHYFLKTKSIIIPPSMTRYSKWPIQFDISSQIICAFLMKKK